MEKATWLPSGENAGSLSRPGNPTNGTISIEGSEASAWFRTKRQIPIAESKTNNIAPANLPHAGALGLSNGLLAEAAVIAEFGLSTGQMKR
jgi:hypothetical protein